MSLDKPTHECIDPSIGALLMSYALGTLADADAERIEQHLLHCPACQQELEEAAPSLEALSTVREQFVARAHEEGEDFESQYKRLAQGKQKVIRPERSRSWLESLWAIVWGRRWIVGTAGAIAFAVLIGLRHGPEPISPPAAKKGSPESLGILSRRTTDSAAVSPMALDKIVPETETQKKPEVVPVEQDQGLPEQHTSIVPSTARVRQAMPEQPETAQEMIAERTKGGAEPMADVMLEETSPAVTGSAMRFDVSAKTDRIMVSDSTAGLNQLAEAVLGEFIPARYANLSPPSSAGAHDAVTEYYYGLSAANESAEKAAGSQVQDMVAKAPGFKVDPESKARGIRSENPDTLFARGRYREAQYLYERQWAKDSTNVSLRAMIGVAALAHGDYIQADASLAYAYNNLPQGPQRDEVGLLLTRTDILSGQLDEARIQLQDLTNSTTDPTKREFAERALAKMDSLRGIR